MAAGNVEEDGGDASRRATTPSAEMHQMLPAIFGFLSLRERGRAAVVCRAWRVASREPALWKELDWRTHKLTTAAVEAASLNCAGLQHLLLAGRENALLTCRLRAPALRTLRLDSLEPKSGCALAALGAAFPSLTALHVLHSHKVAIATLSALAVLLPHLRELHLDDTLVLPPVMLPLASFASLSSLSLRFCALPAAFDLSACASLRALSLAGALDAEDAERPLRLAGTLPPGLLRLDVSLARVTPRELDAWAAAAPAGAILCAVASVDAVAGGPYPPPATAAAAAAAAAASAGGARIFSDDSFATAVALSEAVDDAARWVHAAVGHVVWAFLSLRDIDEGLPMPPPGPRDPSLRTPSPLLVAAACVLSRSAHADMRECAVAMLNSLSNAPQHADAVATCGGLGALLRMAEDPRSELLQELAAEGLHHLAYQVSLHAEDEENNRLAAAAAGTASSLGLDDGLPPLPPRPARLALLAPAVLGALTAAWRTGAPRVRSYAALTLSYLGRMVIHIEPDGSPQQAAALAALLDAGAIPAYVTLMRSADGAEQYAGCRPLAVMSFVGRAGQEAPRFGNHPQALDNIRGMVDAGAVAPLLALLGHAADAEIRAEAAGVVRNLCFSNAPAAVLVAAGGGAAALAALAATTDEETRANGAVESALTGLCNLSCVCAETAAAVASCVAPNVLAAAAADEAADVHLRWVCTVAACGLEAHGASARGGGALPPSPPTTRRSSGDAAATVASGGPPFAALQRLMRGVRSDGGWATDDRKSLVVQVVLQLAFCAEDEIARVAACRALARLAIDPLVPRLVQQEGGREVLRTLSASPSRSVRLEAGRAAAALSLALDHAPRSSSRLRARAPLDS